MQWNGQGMGRSYRRAWGAAAIVPVAMVASAMLSGCISVNAPDKPIVIELNINIKQEVIYRLAADAGNTIENNPGIF
jgi:hypothetical protein